MEREKRNWNRINPDGEAQLISTALQKYLKPIMYGQHYGNKTLFSKELIARIHCRILCRFTLRN